MDQLAINKEVVAQIAGMAAIEVESVAGLAQKPIDIKGFIKNGTRSRSVRVSTDSGVIVIDLFIKVKDDSKVKNVAESVQKNVKEKVQTMTGHAVARVNVSICDIEKEEEIDSSREFDSVVQIIE